MYHVLENETSFIQIKKKKTSMRLEHVSKSKKNKEDKKCSLLEMISLMNKTGRKC